MNHERGEWRESFEALRRLHDCAETSSLESHSDDSATAATAGADLDDDGTRQGLAT